MHRILCCDQACFEYLRHMATIVYHGLIKKGLQLFMKLISSNSAHPEICLLPGSPLTRKGILFIRELIC